MPTRRPCCWVPRGRREAGGGGRGHRVPGRGTSLCPARPRGRSATPPPAPTPPQAARARLAGRGRSRPSSGRRPAGGTGLLGAAGRLQHVPPRGRCSKPEPLGISGRGACELPGCFARSPCRGLSGRELRLTPQGPEAELFPHTNPGQGRGRGVGSNQVNSPHTQCGVRTQSCPTRDAVWDFEQGEGLAVNGHTCGVQ